MRRWGLGRGMAREEVFGVDVDVDVERRRISDRVIEERIDVTGVGIGADAGVL